ncbi:hypothetical protein DCS_03596 [Drechmeria coniospora]|uniref:DUF4604 domain-containing protein n=1 Tax=Drechmeria coniospora TaxID=98403 RepID=A0A151GHK1_DRECN|nr:hypothetical protein DCS_03596 [Drechmeria coniospora]KYK56595.1 hypothetical protein DCS_03596 [Drechmeria coniospora]ODA77035.1 hypothetical protein RJ55_07552 [Drechmeria coniospora]
MSQKVTSKNLSYSSSLPPFLAALRAQTSGNLGPDPLAAGRQRSAKKRSSSEEAEDAPQVVDEHGNALSIEVDKDGAVKEPPVQDDEEIKCSDDSATKSGEKREAEAKVAIGGRKRKVGRLIGDDGVNEAMPPKEASQQRKKDDKQAEASREKKVKKVAKKKVKLSFDQDDG